MKGRPDRRVRTIWNGTMDVRVYEAEGNFKDRALVFETDLGSRIAVVFPVNWQALPDNALLRISDLTPD
jgi:hypothetical protein